MSSLGFIFDSIDELFIPMRGKKQPVRDDNIWGIIYVSLLQEEFPDYSQKVTIVNLWVRRCLRNTTCNSIKETPMFVRVSRI